MVRSRAIGRPNTALCHILTAEIHLSWREGRSGLGAGNGADGVQIFPGRVGGSTRGGDGEESRRAHPVRRGTPVVIDWVDAGVA